MKPQRLWVPARDAYAAGPGAVPRRSCSRPGTEAPLGDLVAARARPTRRSPGSRPTGPARPAGPPGPALAPPGSRAPDGRDRRGRWACPRRPDAEPDLPRRRDHAPPGRSRRRAQPRWTADLGAPPIWVGYLADKLLAATAQPRGRARASNGGAEQWRFDPGTRAAAAPRAGPVRPRRARRRTRRGGPRAGSTTSGSSAAAFFCLPGRRASSLALDGDTGAVDWSFSPPRHDQPQALDRPGAGRAPGPQARASPGPRHRQRPPGRPDSRWPTGRRWSGRRCRSTTTTSLLVTDRRTVELFDLGRGQFTWDFRESRGDAGYGPPRLLGDAERLLVLHDGKTLIRLDPVNGVKPGRARWASRT